MPPYRSYKRARASGSRRSATARTRLVSRSSAPATCDIIRQYAAGSPGGSLSDGWRRQRMVHRPPPRHLVGVTQPSQQIVPCRELQPHLLRAVGQHLAHRNRSLPFGGSDGLHQLGAVRLDRARRRIDVEPAGTLGLGSPVVQHHGIQSPLQEPGMIRHQYPGLAAQLRPLHELLANTEGLFSAEVRQVRGHVGSVVDRPARWRMAHRMLLTGPHHDPRFRIAIQDAIGDIPGHASLTLAITGGRIQAADTRGDHDVEGYQPQTERSGGPEDSGAGWFERVAFGAGANDSAALEFGQTSLPAVFE